MKEELENLIKKAKERATQLLAETENCAYSPFIALAEALELELNEEMKAIPIGFAGGISGSGHICGALWASVAITSIYIKKKIEENPPKTKSFFKKHLPLYMKCAEAYQKFVNDMGSPNCRDLNPSFDLVSEEQRRKCTRIVRRSVENTLRLLLENQ